MIPKSFSMIQFLILLFSYLNHLSYADTATFLTCLAPPKVPQSIIYTTQSQNYTFILQDHIRNGRFNTSTTPKPILILAPFNQSQVQEIVKCAKQTPVLLKIRSGGHDYEGLSYTSKSSFAILDMFNFKSIKIDLKSATAWVDSGAKIGELYYNIWRQSKVHAFPAGVCPSVGLGGHLTGGGYGNLMRKYGLTIDNLVDAVIVDSNARILDREAMGEDLFWAIRGGGGASFGVILSYKINLVPVPPQVTVFSVSKTMAQNATGILHRWQFVADKFDKELFVRVNTVSLPDPNGKLTATVNFLSMYLGDAETLFSIMLKQFPELEVKREDCNEMSWIKAVLVWAEFPAGTPETALLDRNPVPTTFKIKSDYVTTPIPVSGIEGLLRRIEAAGENFYVKFNPYGGRMSEIEGSATAFPYRAGIIYKIQYYLIWKETGADAEAKNFEKMRELYDYMTPFVTKNPRSVYLNYRDLEIGSTDNGPNAYDEGKVYGVKYFGDNFDKLVRVKTQVDPTDLFRNEQSIPLLPN